jgi:hypothetical protein
LVTDPEPSLVVAERCTSAHSFLELKSSGDIMATLGARLVTSTCTTLEVVDNPLPIATAKSE